MNYLFSEMKIGPDDIVEVSLDKPANVRLLDENNYYYYSNELKFNSYGGWAKSFPVHISPPEDGIWNLCIDLGGQPGTLKSTVTMNGRNQFVDMVWRCTETAKNKPSKKGGFFQKLFPKK